MSEHQYILTIAGFDPSNGAGLTSDVKTFQAHGLYGLSVCTSITVQNDVCFKNSYWIETAIILEQIDALYERFKLKVIKIGIVKSWEVLNVILNRIRKIDTNVKIILDPVLKASAGFNMHSEQHSIDIVLDKIDLLTPNYQEIQYLYPHQSIAETISIINKKTNLYLKGGHRVDNIGLDQLFLKDGSHLNLEPKSIYVTPKHGSGCVLSSAIASNIALGYTITESCVLGKRYIEQFLNSTPSLLGNHKEVNNAI